MENYLYALSGNKTEPFSQIKYDREDNLQEIVANNPELLLLPTDPEDYELFLVTREQPIPVPDVSSLSADVLFVDSLAVPVIVEMKRSSDSRIHAEVMTQILNYAAHLQYADFNAIVNKLRKNVERNEGDASFITAEFEAKLRSNIEAGFLKLIIVADSIPSSLARMIEFADRAMKDITVYGVALPQYKVNNTTVLTRSFVAIQQPQDKKKPSAASVQWSKESLIAKFAECGNTRGITHLQKILEIAEKHGVSAIFGSGSIQPTITFKMNDRILFWVYFGLNPNGAGVMEISHQRLLKNYPVLFHQASDVADYLHNNGFEGEIRIGKNSTTFYLRLLMPSNNREAFEKLLSSLSSDEETMVCT